MSTSNMFYVYGCHGTMTVEAGTGKVLNYVWDDPDEKEYADIARIDIPTYERDFGRRINSGDHIDIIFLNFWSYDGQYFVLDKPKARPDDEEYDWPQPVFVLHESTEKEL